MTETFPIVGFEGEEISYLFNNSHYRIRPKSYQHTHNILKCKEGTCVVQLQITNKVSHEQLYVMLHSSSEVADF